MAIAAAFGLGAAAALVLPQPWTAFSPVASASAQQQRSGAGGHGSSGHGGSALGQPGGSSGSGKTGGVGGQFGAGSESHGLGGGGHSGFGYWGGRHVPEGPGDNPGDGTDQGQTPTTDQTTDGSTTGHGAANLGGTVGELHCNGIGAGTAAGEKRMADENLKRLLIVRAMLEKARDSKVPPAYNGGVVNLAQFQAELERTHPNFTLAGMYLGRVADVPVTASMVETASSTLCVPLRSDMAAAIAGVAEAQRQALVKARQRPASKP